jgi:hypothetical protein
MNLSLTERSTVRYGMHVDCQVVRDRDFKRIGRGSLDVSLTGMLVQCTYSAELGDEVIVSFQTPRLREYVDAVAIVTRLIAGRRPGDLGLAMGITFTSIDDVSFAALKRALNNVPTVRGRRASRIDYAQTLFTAIHT